MPGFGTIGNKLFKLQCISIISILEIFLCRLRTFIIILCVIYFITFYTVMLPNKSNQIIPNLSEQV